MKKLFNYFSIFIHFLFIIAILDFIRALGSFSKLLLDYFGLINDTSDMQTTSILLMVIYFAHTLALAYIIWILNPFRKLANNLSLNNLFNMDTSKVFDKVGKGFIVYSIVRFIINWIEKGYEGYMKVQSHEHNETLPYVFGRAFGESISDRLPLVIMGLFLLIISGIILKGVVLKEENDLTI